MQNCVVLGPAQDYALSALDSQQLMSSMQAHIQGEPVFAQTRIEAVTPQLWHWHGSLPEKAGTLHKVSDAAPDALAGQDVADHLPDDPRLKRLQAELQMLLYHHPVNNAREAQGLSPINAIWMFRAPSSWLQSMLAKLSFASRRAR